MDFTHENFLKIREYIKNNWVKTVRKNDYIKDFVMPYDYVSPCSDGVLTELYYWDTYFTNKGLYMDGLDNYAYNNIRDLEFALKTFGCVPNICRKDGADYCSQPPLLFLMVSDYYEKTSDRDFLKDSYYYLKKEYDFWMSKRISDTGLNNYGSNYSFDRNDKHRIDFCVDYYVGRLNIDVDGWSDDKKIEFCENMIAEAESGEDFTPRFKGRAKYVNPIDLNSFLYGFERKMESFSQILKNDEDAFWAEKADHRKESILKYCYDKETGVFFDYDFKRQKKTGKYCVACYMPFIFGISKDLNALMTVNDKLIYDFGVVSCEKTENCPLIYQWGYPNAWAPHQFWAYSANKAANNNAKALAIAEKYLTNVYKSFLKYGILFEKYDAVEGGKTVINEYDCPEMLGWTAGVFNYFYQVCFEEDNNL